MKPPSVLANKGDGKGRKGNNKDGKASSAVPSAAPAVAASTVTITEVDGAKVMEAWKGFCAFCTTAFPSMSAFLKLSVPILATLISSIIDSPHIECVTAASALHPCIGQFKTMSIELLGDTGAAHDIGSLEALQEQKIPVATVKQWIMDKMPGKPDQICHWRWATPCGLEALCKECRGATASSSEEVLVGDVCRETGQQRTDLHLETRGETVFGHRSQKV